LPEAGASGEIILERETLKSADVCAKVPHMSLHHRHFRRQRRPDRPQADSRALSPVQGQADAAGVPRHRLCPPRKTDESWRQELRTALDQFSRTKPVDDKVWSEFAKIIFYCQGDMTDGGYEAGAQLTEFGSGPLRENLLFYLAISPSQFGEVARTAASRRNCCTGKARRGSASSWKSRLATTSPRRRRSTAN
jgi:hypothetical protein